MKRISVIVFCLLMVFMLSSCRKNNVESSFDDKIESEQSAVVSVQSSNQESSTESQVPETILSKPEQYILNMSVEDKIWQMIMIRPDALVVALSQSQINSENKNGVTEFDQEMSNQLKNHPVGGIVLFSKNIKNPGQLSKLIRDMQNSSVIPLFIGVDEEGGSVARIADTKDFNETKYISMQDIGNTKDVQKAYNVGKTIGSYLLKYGFNTDFAPVADVYTNKENKVIGNRSFGNDPLLVSSMVAEEIKGFHDVGVISSVKHFPGHGDTTGDTHKGFVSTEKTWEQLLTCEILPFKSAISAFVDMVMVSHITAPNITKDGLPSSLSYEMVTGKLRNELMFNGVVITDSMSMGAIKDIYTSADSALKAILAGVDIILMPVNYKEAYDSLYNAFKSGILSEERINQSVLRILSLKQKYGML